MKHFLLFAITVLLFVSCSVEEPTRKYTTAIRNASDNPFYILVVSVSGQNNQPTYDTIVNTILNKGEVTLKGETNNNPSLSRLSEGRYFSDIYYTKIVFLDNNKGYICGIDEVNDFCFQNKVSIANATSERDFTFEKDTYYYDITQEDYENAHVLP